MTNRSAFTVNSKSTLMESISWLFGITVFAIGVINSFWGNDPGFGVFLVLLSFIYFPPITTLIRMRLGFTVHRVVKILLGVFIMWAALGVGELFYKINLMVNSF